jgi:hypothetical protein
VVKRRVYWSTKFGRWVERQSVARVARGLEGVGFIVTRGAVYEWLRGASRPRPDHADALVRVSGGAITLRDVYDHRAKVLERVRSSTGGVGEGAEGSQE